MYNISGGDLIAEHLSYGAICTWDFYVVKYSDAGQWSVIQAKT